MSTDVRLSQKAGKIWREHGALEYRECVGDDLKTKHGAAFKRAARLKQGETVLFSWVVFKSRAHHDRVNKKVLKDPRLADMMNNNDQPFDYRRLVYGGFKVVVDL